MTLRSAAFPDHPKGFFLYITLYFRPPTSNTDVKKQRRHVTLVLPQKRLARLLRNVVVLAAPNKSPQFDVPGMPLST
jgi:hypothetical protein